MKSALVIVDMQNDYYQGGSMELAGIKRASQNVSLVLKRAREKNLDIFHIQHIATRKGSTFFLPNTKGVQIHSDVKPLEHESVVKKSYPNSFKETELLVLLQEKSIKSLIFCGAMTHMCIDTTVRAAFDLGFECTLIHDGCATRDLVFKDEKIEAKDVHNAFLAALSSPFANIVSTEDFLEV